MNWARIVAELKGATVPVPIVPMPGVEYQLRWVRMCCRDCGWVEVDEADEEDLRRQLALHRRIRHDDYSPVPGVWP